MIPQATRKLAKFLTYILGHHPDEFGLLVDADGYVRFKDLLKAMNEEAEWRHIRQGRINEILITLPDPPIEISDQRIRAIDRENLPKPLPATELPKLLFTCVRQKAHPFVLKNGIQALGGQPYVIMATDETLADRMGRRFDATPLMLTVQVDWAIQHGVMFLQYGKHIFLARSIPVGAFIAPPLSKEAAEAEKTEPMPEPKKPKTPGSFLLDLSVDPEEKRKNRLSRRKKEMDKDKDRRKMRQQKQKMWPK